MDFFDVSVTLSDATDAAASATEVYDALVADETFMEKVDEISNDGAGTLTITWSAAQESVSVDFDPLTTNVTVVDDNTAEYSATSSSSSITSDPSGNLVLREDSDSGELFGITDLEITTGSNDELVITVGSGNPVNITLDEGTYSNASDLVEQINTQIAAMGVFTGDDALTFTVSTDADGAEGFAVTSATGEAVEVDGTFVTEGLGASAAVTFPGVVQPTGGVDLSADSTVTMSVTDSAGSVFSRTFSLGGNDANTSFADYASLIQAGADEAFADAGFTFTASYSDGEFSLTADQADASGVALSGTSVTAAFGSEVLGSAPVVEVAASRFASMDDVAAAINNDLGDAAVANFDSASGTWSFTATSGLPGANSTIELSGSGLANVQIGGTLSASGSTGNATASRLSDISITTVDGANAAIASIDNAIEYVNSQRAYLGAIQNRLDHTVSNLTNIATNTEASRSRIMDADYGAESANLARSQIIQQAATAMLAQANQSAQSVLSLLQ
jgi:flagellin